MKSKIFISLLLSLFFTPKSSLSQICLENKSNGKIIELDTSQMLTLYAGNNFTFSGQIISFNDTAFVMEARIHPDSTEQVYSYSLSYSRIQKIHYSKLKKDPKNKTLQILSPIITLLVSGVTLALVSKKITDNPAYLLIPTTVFFNSIIRYYLTTKIFNTQKKWKITVCS